jgi:DHA1 family multidrug resistance protein-like MFS transporter/DHA1 family quinolone resistance protein-like MFS transporter
MLEERRRWLPGVSGRAWPLYGAAFATGLSLSTAWSAMSFILIAMGGTRAHVGDAPAVNTLAYMAGLLLTGSRLGHLDVKRATRSATVAAMLATALMALAVFGATTHSSAGQRMWVWLIIAAGGLSGAAMALFWPFLMSWISGSYEGLELNRRLGRYNGSWSSGGVVGPLVGAWLVEKGPLWPMVAAVLCFGVSFLLLGLARRSRSDQECGVAHEPPFNPKSEIPNPQSKNPRSEDLALDARVLADFRWLSRIALFCAWASFAIARSQFALLFTSLGYSKSQFGLYLTTVALCNFLALIAGGRWAFWHFRPWLLMGAQGMVLAALLLVIYGRTLDVLYLSAIVLGMAFGFAYSSHLFYVAATSRKRSVRMVIHEIVISLGVTAGSWPSGHLAQSLGLYAPYWFAVILVGLGILGQIAIHVVSLARVRVPGQAPPVTGVEPAQ